MSTRTQKRTSSTAGRERVAVPSATNGVAAGARHDIDFVAMAKAQIAARQPERDRIATAAYFHAMQRGFQPGHELDDWLAAEAEIANTLLPTEVSTASRRS